jgi:ribosome biogenesis protein BMS1
VVSCDTVRYSSASEPFPDIIFLRAWYSIQPRKFYNPVTSLLLSDKTKWTGMRLTGQIRHDEGIKPPVDINSAYKPIERTTRRFNPLKISKSLQASLPYASKPKIMLPQRRSTYLQKRAVVLEPEERKRSALLQQMRALRKAQLDKRKEKKAEERVTRQKREARRAEEEGLKDRAKRKEIMRLAGQKNRQRSEVEEGRARKRQKR